jgi:hypothetical protein
MRLFRSRWTYLGCFALYAYPAWRSAYPRPHPPSIEWHPVFFGIEFAIINTIAISLVIGAARLTSIVTEKAALALVVITFALSIVVDLHSANLLRLPTPSFRLVYLPLNTLIALLFAIRFIQVLREPPAPGILSPAPATSE